MIDVSNIYKQRIADIQSRIPVNLPTVDKPVISSSNSFQSALKREVNLLNEAESFPAGNKSDRISADRGYIENVVEEVCREHNVSPILVKSIIKAESGFNPNAVSSAGAMGLMQLMPSTAKSWGASDPFNIVQNITAGVKLIKNNLSSYDGNLPLALAAYNAGPGAVSKYGGIPPYTETQNYIKKIIKYIEEYSNA